MKDYDDKNSLDLTFYDKGAPIHLADYFNLMV